MLTCKSESVLNEIIRTKVISEKPKIRKCKDVLFKCAIGLLLFVAFLHCAQLLLQDDGLRSMKVRARGGGPWPRYTQPPTQGELWPRPQIQQKSDNLFTFDTTHLKIEILGNSCLLLTRAVKRHRDVWRLLLQHQDARSLSRKRRHRNKVRRRDTVPPPAPPTPRPHAPQGFVHTLRLHITAPCDAKYPDYEMDESYNLTVAKNSTTLKANSIWGMLHAFETFNQLLYSTDDYKGLLINETRIYDFPRFKYRGLLLDTGNNRLSLDSLYKTLDAMAMNKMNVFHWHIVDDQSFPYVSKKFPTLSEKGAIDQLLVYSAEDIRKFLEYAAGHGIRVIPEFDVLGHIRSWGDAFPALLTKCDLGEAPGLHNPTNPYVYTLLKELFEEVQDLFLDNFFHVGGKQVNMTCWESDPELMEYLKKHHLTAQQLLETFIQRVMQLVTANTTPVVWQDVFELMPLPYNTLVQVWKPQENTSFLEQVIEERHEIVFSSGWEIGGANVKASAVYGVEPRRYLPASMAARVTGGEACVWGNKLHDDNLLYRMWPVTSLVAEVLWSAKEPLRQNPWCVTELENLRRAMPRLEEHACRMRRRGLDAHSPAGPGACLPAHP